MHYYLPAFSRQTLMAAAIVISGSLFGPAVFAANSGTPGNDASFDYEARYQQDVARCKAGQTNQDLRTCLQEAGAARDEARRNRLGDGSAAFEDNQKKRCMALPVAEQEDCLIQMSGQNTTTRGSIGGGGVLRETVIPIPGTPMPAPAPTPAPGTIMPATPVPVPAR